MRGRVWTLFAALRLAAAHPDPSCRRSRAGRGQRRRSARRRRRCGDAPPGRKRDRRRACDPARADRGRTAKLGDRRRRLPGHQRRARDGRNLRRARGSADGGGRRLVFQGRPAAADRPGDPRRQERRRSRQYPDDGAGPSPSMASLPGRRCSTPRSRWRAMAFSSRRGCAERLPASAPPAPCRPRRAACFTAPTASRCGRDTHSQSRASPTS